MLKYAKGWGGIRENNPGMDNLPLGKKCAKIGCGFRRWKLGGREAPLWNILTNRRICISVPPLVGGSTSEVVELDWRGWVTVSREPACPAALHPRCVVVDICSGSCLKVGH